MVDANPSGGAPTSSASSALGTMDSDELLNLIEGVLVRAQQQQQQHGQGCFFLSRRSNRAD